ncbi:MAG: hypothetical protein KC478_11305 [Bacteriovoracaceae bacterium]|nr:hypothetical protein [Bacteriovoracaceae bacterium]
MALLRFEDGSTTNNLEEIKNELAPMGVTLNKWRIDNEEALGLLEKESLEDSEKETLLGYLDHYFEALKKESGYKSRDLIVLSPKIPNLDELLKKFQPAHTHADDEVRFIIDGEGVFGFTRPDNSQVELLVEAEDYINVPKNTEHWFYLTDKKRIKAIRYFSGTDGWTPEYTGSEIKIKS